MPTIGTVLKSRRSHGKYVREAIVRSYNPNGHVLYDMREHWGNPRKGEITRFMYRPVERFNDDYVR